MINQILKIDKSPIQQQLSELWNVSPNDEDYMQRVEMILMEFKMVFSSYATSDQTRMKLRILKKLDQLRQTKDIHEVIAKIISIDIGIQFLDPSLSNIGKYAPLEEAHALKNLSKKIYIPIGRIVERYEKLCKLFDFPIKEKLMENLLLRKDKSLLSLSERVFLYVNFTESQPIKTKLFNFMIDGCQERDQLTLTNGRHLTVVNLFPNLTALNIIKGSNLNDSIFEAIANLKLDTLIIDGAQNDDNIEGHGLKAIVNMPLKSLTLRGFPITDAAMPHIVKMTTIENLDISDTHITDYGLIDLDKAINIKKLSLNSCDLTKRGVFYIKNMDIQELNMGWIEDFEKNGMEDVIQSLLQMKNLNSLDLRGAKITPEELLDLSDLPLQFIDLRRGIDREMLCLNVLLDFALEIKRKHNIDVTCRHGNVLEWKDCKLNKQNDFDVTDYRR